MDTKQMEQLFRTHREAEKRRDFDGIMKTFTENCYWRRSHSGAAAKVRLPRVPVRCLFSAFPDLTPMIAA